MIHIIATRSSNLGEDNLEFILTCISINGPATTVIWTKDSVPISGATQQTIVNNRMRATYFHTLSVRSKGQYTCTVANNKPSNSSSSILIRGILYTIHIVEGYTVYNDLDIYSSLQVPHLQLM